MPKFNRRSTIYKEIEKFKDYELFIGIIYEMYLRHMVYINNIENDNVVDYINKLRNEQYKNINNSQNVHFSTQEVTIDKVILYKSNYEIFTLADVIYNIYPSLYNEQSYHNGINKMSLNNFLEMIKDDNHIFNEAYFYNKEQNQYIKLTKPFITDEVKKQFYMTTKTFDIKYCRPVIYHTDHKIINLNNINLSLSNQDICSYLDILRREIPNTDEKILSTSVQKYIKFEPNGTIPEKSNFEVTGRMKNSKKMADLFFIYDVLEFDKRKTKAKRIDYIQTRIHFNNNDDKQIISIQTINNYYGLAKKLIKKGHFIYLHNENLTNKFEFDSYEDIEDELELDRLEAELFDELED